MRWTLLSVAAVLLAAPLTHAADATALLDKAQASMKELEYGNALKSIEAARKESNNSRAIMVRLFELQGVSYASMGQDAKALKAFQALLSLAPDFRLQGNYPPKVTTVFFEARSWIDAKKPLTARGGGSVMTPGSVKEVKIELSNDPLKLAREVRFHLTVDGKQKDVDVAITGTSVIAPVGAPKVQWWAELLGEKDAVLLALGSAEKPYSDTAPDAPAPVAKPEPKPEPKPELKPAPKPEAVVTAPPPAPKAEPDAKPAEPPIDAWAELPVKEPARPMPGTRVAGIVLGGAGVAAAGVGVAFGAMAAGTASQLTNAAKDADGRIIGITRARALELDAQQRLQATVANVLIISGAALAAGGVTLIIVSARDTKVAVTPTAGGVSVAGSF